MSLRQTVLRPLTPLYGFGVTAHQHLLDAGCLRTETLPGIVLSVGSLSAGGAGKTPFVLALAQALDRLGFPVRILSRGYGRRSTATLEVDPAGSPVDFGDEPLLLARRSGVPVVVGRSRFQAGLLAETLPASSEPIIHLLDDGFQHRRLVRDLDLVLLTREDAADTLLPAGNLREPLTALRRADILVLREDEAPSLERLARALPSDRDHRAVVLIRRALHLPPPTAASPHPSRPLLFSGIARPHTLPSMLVGAGLAPPVRHIVFPDHHRYTAFDIDRLLRSAHSLHADGIVTTEKDAVKLTPAMRKQLAAVGPLLIPELSTTFVDEPAALAVLFALLPRLNRRRHPR